MKHRLLSVAAALLLPLASNVAVGQSKSAITALKIVAPTTLVPSGQSVFLSAIATTSTGASQNVTAEANWVSQNPSIATVHGGIVIPVGVGTVQITVADGSATSSIFLTIQTPSAPKVVSLATNQTSSLIIYGAGTVAQVTATATYSDGSTKDVTSLANWSSSNALNATVANGLVTGVQNGFATILATYGGSSVIVNVNVLALTVKVGTVNSVAAGNPASVQNVGTSASAVLNFNIPKGLDGGASAPATAATPGSVQLAAGQVSTQLSKAATTGLFRDLSFTKNDIQNAAGLLITPEAFESLDGVTAVPGTTDETQYLNECFSSVLFTCKLQRRVYLHKNPLTLVSYTHVVGAGFVNGTELKCEFNGPCVGIAAGPVQGVVLENFNVKLDSTLAYSQGFNITGTPSAIYGNTGGLYDSVFRDIQVDDPATTCLTLNGGGGFGYNFLLPNQFLDFYHFNCNSYETHTGDLIHIDGQSAQVNFYGGQLNGASASNLTPVGISIVQKTPGLNDGPGAINFYGMTVQNAVKGFYITEANNVHIDHGYIENVQTPVDAAFSLNISFDWNTINNSGTVWGIIHAENGVTGEVRGNAVQSSSTPTVAYGTCQNQNDVVFDRNTTNQANGLSTDGCTTVQLNQDNYDGTYRDSLNDPGNKFNPATATADVAINTATGTADAEPGYTSSALIRVQPNSFYTVSSATSGLDGYGFAFYDITGAYLGGLSGVAARTTFETINNDNVRYVRYSFPTADLNTEMFMPGQTLTSSFTPFSGGTLYMPSNQIYLQGDGGVVPITTIVAAQNSGNTVQVIANGSPLYFGTGPGQNISFEGFTTPLVVPAGTTISFRRFDLGQTWAVESVTGVLPNATMTVPNGTAFPDIWGNLHSVNANATVPNVPGSTGIANEDFCSYLLRYSGSPGTYQGTANCNNSGVTEFYRAQALLGQETWTLVLSIDSLGNMTLPAGANLNLSGVGGAGGSITMQNGSLHELIPLETGVPSAGTDCSKATHGGLIPDTFGHAVVCQIQSDGTSWLWTTAY